MANRKSHNTKSSLDKQIYVNYIRSQNYEPTKEEGLDFNESSDKEEDYSVGKTKKPVRLNLKDQILLHFSNNWISWAVSTASVILIYVGYTSKMEILKHEIKLEQNKKEIENNNLKIEDIKQINFKQDLQIQENKIRIDYIEKPTKIKN